MRAHDPIIGETVADRLNRALTYRYGTGGTKAAFLDAAVFRLYHEDACGASDRLARKSEWSPWAREVATTLLTKRAQLILGPNVRVVEQDGQFVLLRSQWGATSVVTVLGDHPVTSAEGLDVILGQFIAAYTSRLQPEKAEA